MDRDWLNHKESSQVDVIQHSYGEFVQVWDGPWGRDDRRLLLTYIRTRRGPSEVSNFVYPDEGPYEMIETCGCRRDYCYRGTNERRIERILPSGRLLAVDPTRGLRVRVVFSKEFDWEKMVPQGRKLKSTRQLELNGLPWFTSWYQEVDGEGSTMESSLMVVEAYVGTKVKRLVEVGNED